MPRARIITPDFWLDEELAKVSERTQLIYIGLWNFADCNGILENNIERIRVQIFPYRKINIKKNIDELIDKKKIIPYEVGEKKYFWIKNFLRYQRGIKHPYRKYPTPPPQILQQHPTEGGLLTPIKEREREKEREKERERGDLKYFSDKTKEFKERTK